MEEVVEDQELEIMPLEPGGEVEATSVRHHERNSKLGIEISQSPELHLRRGKSCTDIDP
jgi:hypothetical protein